MSFEKGKISISAEYMTSTSTIVVRVMDKDSFNETEITDWVIDEVDREENNISSFVATYTSKTAKKYDWKPDATVAIDVTCTDGSSISYHFEYKTVDNKNKWTDYVKVWEKGIVFERVK